MQAAGIHTERGPRFMTAYEALVVMVMFLHIIVDLLIAQNSNKK